MTDKPKKQDEKKPVKADKPKQSGGKVITSGNGWVMSEN